MHAEATHDTNATATRDDAARGADPATVLAGAALTPAIAKRATHVEAYAVVGGHTQRIPGPLPRGYWPVEVTKRAIEAVRPDAEQYRAEIAIRSRARSIVTWPGRAVAAPRYSTLRVRSGDVIADGAAPELTRAWAMIEALDDARAAYAERAEAAAALRVADMRAALDEIRAERRSWQETLAAFRAQAAAERDAAQARNDRLLGAVVEMAQVVAQTADVDRLRKEHAALFDQWLRAKEKAASKDDGGSEIVMQAIEGALSVVAAPQAAPRGQAGG